MLQFRVGRIRICSCAAVALGAVLSLPAWQSAKADPTAYEVTYPSDSFGTVDLATGSFNQTSVLPFIPSGLAEVGSKLYVSAFGGTEFDQINPASGAAIPISNVGLGGAEYLALGSAGNTIYALDGSFNLYTVNPVTGLGTLVGSTGLSPTSAYQLSTGSSVLYFASLNELYTLNTTTGAPTDLGATPLSDTGGFDALISESGILYGGFTPDFTQTSFYTIDPATLAVTLVSTQSAAVGLAWGLAAPIPEAGSLATLGVALLGFFTLRHSRLRSRH